MLHQTYLAAQKLLATEFDVSFISNPREFQKHLTEKINHLIQNDFTKLINILYRIDVDETKLKETLKTQPHENAGDIISELIIERLVQKIKFREEFTKDAGPNDNTEKW